MDQTLKVLNDLEKKHVIERYAIGGAIAAIFYMEPILTYDLDIFVLLPESPTGLIVLSPVYEYLRRKGYKEHKEHVLIEGVPVQFIPAYNELVKEAVEEAVERRYKRVGTRVLRAEHLLAIMLQTGRPKDRARMTHLLEEAKINADFLRQILKRHGLQAKWQEFRRRFCEK
ncbi:hypothetical protein FJY63_00220 [Candidatus Sumerlaeota bacterium]|nr:hypothetical protein [Candidatus Sumerlaeota bacterium]